jgi:hypothetical protein
VNAISSDTTGLKLISLNTQIKHAERQLHLRQRRLDAAAAKLLNSFHRQITSAASLWLAGGSGFIIGELTHTQSSKANGSTPAKKTTPLMTLMNFVSLLHTALPLLWMIRSFYLAEEKPD